MILYLYSYPSEKIWVILMVSIVVSGVTLWLLQKVWASKEGGRGLGLSSAFLFSWSAMMEHSPNDTPTNTSGRVSRSIFFHLPRALRVL